MCDQCAQDNHIGCTGRISYIPVGDIAYFMSRIYGANTPLSQCCCNAQNIQPTLNPQTTPADTNV